jgi:hypothetical protein
MVLGLRGSVSHTSRSVPDEIDLFIPHEIQKEVSAIVDEFVANFGPMGVPFVAPPYDPRRGPTGIPGRPATAPPVDLSVWFQALAVWNARKLARRAEATR